MTVDVYVGEQVHNLMWRRKITNRRMAEALGIDESTMGRKLRGERKWSLDELVEVSGELGVSPAALLPDDDEWAPRGSNPQPTVSGFRQLQLVPALAVAS